MYGNKYAQFLLEKELGSKLLASNKEERRIAYKSLYGELFSKFPHIAYNPQSDIVHKLEWQIKFLKPFLNKSLVFMEIGAGNCLLSIEVCKHVKQVIAYEVADAIPHIENKPSNLILKIFDGIDFDEVNDSVDIIYSNQVFEHLHPEDALWHVQQYFKFLKKGGKVVIITPHCLTGPHDISRNYSKKPEGFHMKEYNYQELKNILLNAGFLYPKFYIGNKKYGYYFFPNSIFVLLEKIYNKVPLNTRYRLKNNQILLNLFRIKMVAKK